MIEHLCARTSLYTTECYFLGKYCHYTIINKAQFSLVKTNLYRIEKVQNKSRCMYCRLPLGHKKMKRDIINSEPTKMTESVK